MNRLEPPTAIRISSRGQTTIALTAGNNSRRLSTIRDTLAGFGLTVSTNWSKRELYAPANTLQVVCDALQSECLLVDPDLQKHIAVSRNGQRNIRLAKIAVAE